MIQAIEQGHCKAYMEWWESEPWRGTLMLQCVLISTKWTEVESSKWMCVEPNCMQKLCVNPLTHEVLNKPWSKPSLLHLLHR